MVLYNGASGPFIAVYWHAWSKPRKWIAMIGEDYKETMVCFGFFTTHYERFIDG